MEPCKKCDLWKTRKNIVVYRGSEKPKILFVGEAPGYWEDYIGLPFVGESGQLLNEWITELELDDFGVTNVVRCRPPGNRMPTKEEVSSCLPYLIELLERLKPKLIVTLGLTATTALLGRDVKMRNVVYKSFPTQYGKVFVMYHPSYLLRTRTKDSLEKLKEVLKCTF